MKSNLRRYILLAEDNPDDQVVVRRAIRYFQHIALEIAADGKEALDVVAALLPVIPALVILDTKMPRMSGLEALCQMRAGPGMAETPIVMFSSSNEPRDLAEAERCKATEFVLKPVEFDDYVEAVRRLVIRYVGI